MDKTQLPSQLLRDPIWTNECPLNFFRDLTSEIDHLKCEVLSWNLTYQKQPKKIRFNENLIKKSVSLTERERESKMFKRQYVWKLNENLE